MDSVISQKDQNTGLVIWWSNVLDIPVIQKYRQVRHRKYGMPDRWKAVGTALISAQLRFAGSEQHRNRYLPVFSWFQAFKLFYLF